MRALLATVFAVIPPIAAACAIGGLGVYDQGPLEDGSIGGNDSFEGPAIHADSRTRDTASRDEPTDSGSPMDRHAQDSAVEAKVDAGACDPTAMFGAPTPVSSLNDASINQGAELTPDEFTVYFESTRPPAPQPPEQPVSFVFTASRSSADAAFGPVSVVMSLNPSGSTFNVTLTGDSHTAYLVNQASQPGMYYTTRMSSLASFGQPHRMPSPITAGEQPFVTPSGLALYYTDPLDGSTQVARATGFPPLAPEGTTPVVTPLALPVAGLSTGVPVVNPSETLIYFAAYTPGNINSYDIYTSSRGTADASWSTPVPVTELNVVDGFEAPTWISPNGCTLYLTRAAPSPAPFNPQIYVAVRHQ